MSNFDLGELAHYHAQEQRAADLRERLATFERVFEDVEFSAAEWLELHESATQRGLTVPELIRLLCAEGLARQDERNSL